MYNLNYTPTTSEYKVEEKLYLGVREQKRLNTTGLNNWERRSRPLATAITRPHSPGLLPVRARSTGRIDCYDTSCLSRRATELNSVVLVRERTTPTDRPPLVGEVVPTFADRGCCVVSATDSRGR
jgi:hypothetical protein